MMMNLFNDMEPLPKLMCRTDRHVVVHLQPNTEWKSGSTCFGLLPSSAAPKQRIFGYVETAPFFT
jgi:hypothetical protein